MDYKKLAADLLSGCEENCANCEYVGDSEFECTIAKLAATAITELLANDHQVKESLRLNGFETLDSLLDAYNQVRAENAALRKMQPVQLDDTGAKAAALAAEVSELRQKLTQAEQACAYYKHSMESYREGAKARYKLLNEARERANEACAKWAYRAKKAEEDRDRMLEAMRPNCLMCDSMHENGNCTEVGGFCTAVPAAHCPLIPKLIARVKKLSEALEQERLLAEKAESERDEAVDLIGWIYKEAVFSVEHDMRQYLDWLKAKIEEWRTQRGDDTSEQEELPPDLHLGNGADCQEPGATGGYGRLQGDRPGGG